MVKVHKRISFSNTERWSGGVISLPQADEDPNPLESREIKDVLYLSVGGNSRGARFFHDKIKEQQIGDISFYS